MSTTAAKVNRKEVDKQDFVVVKDKRTLDVTKVIAPHELQIGLNGYKRASLRIEGDEFITGRLVIDSGCKGALTLLDGTSAIKAGTGTIVVTGSDGSATVSVDPAYIAARQAGVTVTSGGGLASETTPDGLLSLSVSPSYLPSKILAGSGISVSNSNGQLTLNLNVTAGSGIQLNTNQSGQVEISAQAGAGESTFQDDIIVSLASGKTFGRYISGDVIPATGKTAAEVLQLAAVEPISPTVSLTSSTTIQFNQTNISNVINFSHVINSLNASVSEATLQWRRGNTGSWITLSTSKSASSTYTHTLTDTSFNTQEFNYRYIVADSTEASATATLTLTPAPYQSPTISLTVAGANLAQIESNAKREKGNVSSNLSGTITRQSARVNLVSYMLQYSTDGNTWINLNENPVLIGPGTSSITQFNHDDPNLKNSSSLKYRVKVIDTYQQHLSSAGVMSNVTTVSFLNLIFYGSVSQAPINSNDVRALQTKMFTDGGNPFTINTGTVNRIFSFALPTGTGLTSVIDVDALNANITTSYVKSTFNVLDYGGTATSYDVYTMINAEPYSPNSHAHRVTRS